MEVPRFANQGDDLRLRSDKRLHSRVILRLHSTASCHAKSRHFGVGQIEFAHSSKIFGVLLIGERVSSFDILHAHLIEPPRDLDFIDQRKAYALALGAIAQGGVVDLDLLHLLGARFQEIESIFGAFVRLE